MTTHKKTIIFKELGILSNLSLQTLQKILRTDVSKPKQNNPKTGEQRENIALNFNLFPPN
jgi:hypothetical protein